LIGDPKQSIYGFRGADIHNYLAARRATAGRHHVLGTNYRSTQTVVDVVNRWFQITPDAFGYRQEGDDPLPFQPAGAKGRSEVFKTSAGEVNALTVVHDATLRSQRDAQTHLSALCAEQIVAWLSDPQARFADADKGDQALQPKDIAVLVRTGKEAAAVREALRARGVASVYLSDRDSVFASDEAQDLCLWLRGVAEPQDMRRVRAALGTRTVGLSLAELHDLATQDELLDQRAEQMRELRLVWQGQGVLAMLRQSLHVLKLAGRWRGQSDGERRLTNVLHLAELLQTASSRLDGEQALIRWLVQQMTKWMQAARATAKSRPCDWRATKTWSRSSPSTPARAWSTRWCACPLRTATAGWKRTKPRCCHWTMARANATGRWTLTRTTRSWPTATACAKTCACGTWRSRGRGTRCGWVGARSRGARAKAA